MNSQREKNEFCDVILQIDNIKFPAHKTVLAAFSPFFKVRVSHVLLILNIKNNKYIYSFLFQIDYVSKSVRRVEAKYCKFEVYRSRDDESAFKLCLYKFDHYYKNELSESAFSC